MKKTETSIKATVIAAMIILFMAIAVTPGCFRDATIASHNISKEADQFRVRRRVVFYNAITDTYMFEMVGNLSIHPDMAEQQLEVTVKIGENEYRKHFLGLSDNVTYVVEQLDYSSVSKYKYELIFKPQSIIPVSINKEP